jgi:transposase
MAICVEEIKSNKIRQLSIEQQNAIDHLLQGKSDRAVAAEVGVSRTTVWEWRNHDPLFIAELNRERSELWMEARGRLKLMANRALDVLEQQLDGDDPKASLTAAKYILQGTKLLGDTDLPAAGPTTPEAVIMEDLRREAHQELTAERKQKPMYSGFDPVGAELEKERFADDVETLATSRLKEALKKAGLA